MAEGQSMTTVANVVARVRDGRLEDFVREAVAIVARELREAEISAELGAGLGEVAPETRLTHRNGYRPQAPCRALDEQVELFCQRPLEGCLPLPSRGIACALMRLALRITA